MKDKRSCIRIKADIEQINRCKERVWELDDTINCLSSVLELAGNRTRLKILFLVHEEKRLCVCDLSDILDMTVSAVSQHLRKLRDRNLIYSEKEAQTIYYAIIPERKNLLMPFFKILKENKLFELV